MVLDSNALTFNSVQIKLFVLDSNAWNHLTACKK